MPETFAVTDAVELAVVERSGFIESRHAGSAIVLDPDGGVVSSLGAVDAPILPRSTLKPMQALASVSAGAALEGAHLAVATASHSGTDRHVALVTDILSAAGLAEDALQCPPSWPGDPATRDEMTRELIGPQRVRMNCSGKHAAMLLACQTNGWDTATYLDPQHPLQVHTREVIERLSGTKITTTAIDGCGAPVHAMTLAALARALHRIGASSEKSPFALHRSAGALVRAVRENPWVIQGPGQPDSVVTERLGVFAKHGAEGVMAMIAPNGTTVVLKMLDGSTRAGAVTALTLLVRAGALQAADVARTLADLPLTVTGGGRDVGVIRPTV
ncbi:asparaginase [Microbacterium oleivorans]|uniref:asparaginase n=1 Tax=Microbacterium TaxID=33882 RepID=UPI00203F348C|nr:asparaginase [Microbacterium oleivorans]MCM3695851.1 asparaginase [Microbacterium oleivorans]